MTGGVWRWSKLGMKDTDTTIQKIIRLRKTPFGIVIKKDLRELE